MHRPSPWGRVVGASLGLLLALSAAPRAVLGQPAEPERGAPAAPVDVPPAVDAPEPPEEGADEVAPAVDVPAEAMPSGDVPIGALPTQDTPAESEPSEAAAERADAGAEATTRVGRQVRTLQYSLQDIEIVGNRRTKARVIRALIHLRHGDVIDPESGELEAIEWRMRATGWFDEVHLRLRRGDERGWVVLVIEVRERNTMVIRDLVFGISEGLSGSRDPNADILPYVGFSIAETNLSGTGIALQLDGLMSQTQQGGQLGFVHPAVGGSPYALRAGVFLNNAREFFGNDPLISQRCPAEVPDCVEEVEAKNAVVFYRRGGVRVGFGRAIGSSTFYSIDWQGEVVRVLSRPEAASTLRGTEVRPIDFAIEDGTSFVSVLRLGLLYDRRDDPGLPSQGTFLRLSGDLGSRLLGSSYDFVRFEGLARWWHAIRPRHILRLSGYAGVVFGDAPFFYKFHVSDLTDLIPSRVLDMQIDRRPAKDLLGTTVRYMQNEEIAWRLDVQYDFAVYRTLRRPSLRGLNLYFNVGLYGLADPLDFRVAVPGFDGFSRVPVDLTFDLGVVAETTIGVFQFGFSNLLGFIDL